MAGRKPGTPKTGGRKKGSQNVVTKEIKEQFKDFVDGNFHKVQGWINRVSKNDPAEAARLYLQFSERIIGKMSNSSVDLTSAGKQLTVPAIHVYGGGTDTE